MMQALKEDVLTNKFIWLFAIAYFFVYVVRQGVTSWFVFYLKVGPCLPVGWLLPRARRVLLAVS